MSTPAPQPNGAQQRVPDRDSYSIHADQARSDRQSSSDAYDKSLLTFSSGALALSLAFVKDIVPLASAIHLRYLYFSWVAFAGCIVFTIFSYPISQIASDEHLKYLYEYYINRNDSYFQRKSGWLKAVQWFGVIAGVLFLIGMILTVVFAYTNISRIHR